MKISASTQTKVPKLHTSLSMSLLYLSLTQDRKLCKYLKETLDSNPR